MQPQRITPKAPASKSPAPKALAPNAHHTPQPLTLPPKSEWLNPCQEGSATMEPLRTCVGCRSRAPQTHLLRFVARGTELVVDEAAVLPGRGAWIHPNLDCYHLAEKRRAFGRALRAGNAIDTTHLEKWLNG
ncbi:YlxR family protein [Okibacterium fritillariae]|uniref:YlxR family protein n=1 Tax=Okibacterium fritillariae TaxID=123320 RepID=UPI004055475F